MLRPHPMTTKVTNRLLGRAAEDSDPEDGKSFHRARPVHLCVSCANAKTIAMTSRCAGTREEGIFQLLGLVHPDHALDLRAVYELYSAAEEDSGCA
jgi:hypothetical protein